MRIGIPENVQAFGEDATCLHAMMAMQIKLDLYARKIRQEYSIFPINDLKAFELNAILRIIQNIESFCILNTQGKDYNACCTLARSIADSIATIKLIYHSGTPEECSFRHYLSILDGISLRAKLLNVDMQKTERITDEEFTQLSAQMQEASQNCQETIDYCMAVLNSHPYKSSNARFWQIAVRKKAWKYKSTQVRNGELASYKWKEMYKLLDERDSIVAMYSDFFSQHVHGLILSNIPGQNDSDNFDSVASIIVCLQGELSKILDSYFKSEEVKGFATMDDMFMYLALCDRKKQEELLKGFQIYTQNRSSEERN